MSTAYDFDLLCIGSGPAGQRPAVQAAKLGKRVAVVEKRTCVGGTCLDLGTIPSKTFREAVCSLAQGNSLFNRSQAVMELGGWPPVLSAHRVQLSHIAGVLQGRGARCLQ
ncbi:MAG: sthA [Nitrospira sp.]|jgi:NAD(P) transhydrogenase|nr:sthA [Nitrospira sp.]